MAASSSDGYSGEHSTRHGMAAAGVSTWEFVFEGCDEEQQRVQNALFALAGGGLGTSGGPLLAQASAGRWIIVAGVYDGDGPETQLLTGPVLSGVEIDVADARLHRTLDLRSGVLRERIAIGAKQVEMVRFVSLVRPGIVAVRTFFPEAIERGGARGAARAGRR